MKDRPLVVVLIVLVLIIVGGLIVSLSCDKTATASDILQGLSTKEKLEVLIKKYDYYTKCATKEELMMKWITLFSDSTYKKGGRVTNNEFDCSSAFWFFLREFGSEAKRETVKEIVNRFESYMSLGKLKPRKKFEEIDTTDVVVFNPVSGEWHIAIVIETGIGKRCKYIRYMEVTSRVGGWSFSEIEYGSHGSSKIYGVYPLPFVYFIGDLLKHLELSSVNGFTFSGSKDV